MIGSEILRNISHFYHECDKPTFWFGVLMMCRISGAFSIPQVVIYAGMVLYALFLLFQRRQGLYAPLVVFLIYIPLQLIVVNPNPIFKSWERYVLFLLMIICVSSLIEGAKTAGLRKKIFQIMLFFCIFLGVGSFFAKFLGINFMLPNERDYVFGVGTFGGLTTHSMTLGPIAGIGVIYGCYLSMRSEKPSKKRIYWMLTALCACAMFFSASRSALLATIGGSLVAIYRMKGAALKSFKTIVGIAFVGILSFPIWSGTLDAVIAKNNGNIAAGSMYSSREDRWVSRIDEFKSSPLFGVGFDAVDMKLSAKGGQVDVSTGTGEAGSSWLTLLSMTGVIGTLLLLPVFITSYTRVFKKKGMFGGLTCGVLTLFYIHMMAEGYIFYGGSPLAFMVWLTMAVAHDS